MAVARKDYTAVQGYGFSRAFGGVDGDVNNWDFRWSIYDVGGSDLISIVSDGITIDDVKQRWQLQFSTDDIPTGTYRYSHDIKPVGGTWIQISTGEFAVTNPREKP